MLVGLDVLAKGEGASAQKRLSGARVGVLTHAPAINAEGRTTWEVLRGLAIEPGIIFSPEHGLDGLAEAEEPVGRDDGNVGGVPLVSLYGQTKESLTPQTEQLEGLDVLVIDLVDVGSRYYTYVWTALMAARAAADAGVHTLVLDRPNPISGNAARLEGRPQDLDLCSFVGLEPIPVRHSMTVGEILAVFFNLDDRPLGREGALSVVPTRGWERHRLASSWGRPFVPPSPNMPTCETALLYPGGCLLEGTNLSEGRGTTRPFHLVGAPFVDGATLAEKVGTIPGAWVRPTRFRPAWDKHAGQVCGGLSLHVKDEASFRPLAAYLTIIAAARSLYPEEFRLADRVYEFETEHRAFDLLTGTKQAGDMLEQGCSAGDLISLLDTPQDDWAITVETAEELTEEVRA